MKTLALIAALAAPTAALALPCDAANAKFPPAEQARIAALMAAS